MTFEHLHAWKMQGRRDDAPELEEHYYFGWFQKSDDDSIWDYKVTVGFNIQSSLVTLGLDGWQLVGTTVHAQILANGLNNMTYNGSIAVQAEYVFSREITPASLKCEIRTASKEQIRLALARRGAS